MREFPVRYRVVLAIEMAFAVLFWMLQACAPTVPTALPTIPPSTTAPTPHLTIPPTSATIEQTGKQPPLCNEIGQTWMSPMDQVTLVCVPAGEFQMGAAESDAQAKDNEKPQHQVYLDTYWIDRTEATNAIFQKCVMAGVCRPRPPAQGTTGVASARQMNYYYDAAFADYPVLTYQVEDAQTYCKWAGRRLPTEAEWEKAARGTDGRPFPWGTESDCAHGTFFGCTKDTTDVHSPTAGASPYGVLNMVGNVWEWVSDYYAADYYAHSPTSNPTGPSSGSNQVLRGGGWRSITSHLRVTARIEGVAQHYFDGQEGFRCAMSETIP